MSMIKILSADLDYVEVEDRRIYRPPLVREQDWIDFWKEVAAIEKRFFDERDRRRRERWASKEEAGSST